MDYYDVSAPAYGWDLGSTTAEEFNWSTIEELREEVLRWQGGDFVDFSDLNVDLTLPLQEETPGLTSSGVSSTRNQSPTTASIDRHLSSASATAWTTSDVICNDSTDAAEHLEAENDEESVKGACRLQKRKAQNRAAQRAFRQRKESQLQSLQTTVTTLTAKIRHLQAENERLKDHIVLTTSRSSQNQTSQLARPACHEGGEMGQRVSPSLLNGSTLAAMERQLLSAAAKLDASAAVASMSPNGIGGQGDSHRALVFGIMACLRSLMGLMEESEAEDGKDGRG